MAILYWRGGTDGDFSNVNNWVTAAGATPGAAPVNSDTLYFDKGNVNVDAGLTTGLTGITLVGTSGYTGTIAPGSHLSIACASVRWQNSGTLNLTGNITAGKIRCRTGSSFSYGGGTATALFIERTDYQFAAAAVVTTARTFMSFGSDLNNGTAYTAFYMRGGQHSSRREGVFYLDDKALLKAKPDCTLGDGTTLRGKSTIEYTSIDTIANEVIVYPESRFDASGSPGFTWSGELRKWPGAIVNLDTASGTVTPSTVENYGLGDEVGDFVPIP